MTYPCMKFCGLGPKDYCVVRSESEEAELEGVWADTPAAFYTTLPPGCEAPPKPQPRLPESVLAALRVDDDEVEEPEVEPVAEPAAEPVAACWCGSTLGHRGRHRGSK